MAKATTKKDGRGRPYEMPDPDDRSVNAPHVIVEGKAVVGYIRQTVEPKAKVVSQTVRDGYEAAAKSAGWADITWVGDAAVLKADITRK